RRGGPSPTPGRDGWPRRRYARLLDTEVAMPDDVVLYEVTDGVAVITLNRPDRLNAWVSKLEGMYFGYLEQAAADPEVKVVVLTGAGRGFCAGADMDDLQEIGEAGGFRTPTGPRKPATYPMGLRKPLIAAV